MSAKELDAFAFIQKLMAGKMTPSEVAQRLSVTTRTVRRWRKAVRRAGAAGLVHGSRGKRGPRRVPKSERKTICRLVRETYPDFTATMIAEKLASEHGIVRHRTTVTDVLITEGVWVAERLARRRQIAVHREWRERRSHRGELIQFDGSYHDWLEGRGGTDSLCLLAAIDDATGEVLRLVFAPHEGTLPVMSFWLDYAQEHGLPKAIYLDRFSTYKMNEAVARDNPDLKTQLKRAMDTVGAELIFALSPQAKGRVERLFRTLQDRLVKEMRLRKISTTEEANRYMAATFIRDFNRRFAISPRKRANFHRAVSRRELADLRDVLCRIEERTAQNDFTVSWRNQWYQLLPTPRIAVRPRDSVLIREYPDGTFSFSVRNRPVNFLPIQKRAERKATAVAMPILAPTLPNRTNSFHTKADKFMTR